MKIRPLKEQWQIKDEILDLRLKTVLKDAFEASGIDAWLIPSKEYCEDPMFKLLTPSAFLTARRISVLLLYYNGSEVEKYCCNMRDEGLEKFYTNVWTDQSRDQFEVLNETILKLNPKKIGVDVSESYAYFDGFSKGFSDFFNEKLSKEVTDKFVSAESLGILYTEKRSELELSYYPEIMEVAKEIIEEAFSSKVITPGVTTTDDVEWFMKEKVLSLGLDFWFAPDVNLQNEKSPNPMQNGDTVINKGDLLHCDFGIVYMGLCTDTQRLCYVLKDGETELPPSLKKAYEDNMRFHQIVRESFKEGLTGNEVFALAVGKGKEEGLKPMLYTHPLGNFGHAPGPTIGLFSNQGNVYPAGELRVHENTGYALELNTREYVDIYDKETFMFTEESVVFSNGELRYLSTPCGIYLI